MGASAGWTIQLHRHRSSGKWKDCVGMTLHFDVSGWRSQKRLQRKSKTWPWTWPLKGKRKKNRRRLLRLNPSRQQHDRLSTGKKNLLSSKTGHRTNHLLPRSLNCLQYCCFYDPNSVMCRQSLYQTCFEFAHEALGLSTSLCWLRLACLLSQCLGCIISSCKYFVWYVLLIFFLSPGISFHSSCLKAQAHCTVWNITGPWHKILYIIIIIIFFCSETLALQQTGQFVVKTHSRSNRKN